jgi:Flp pilus assembly protein TadD
LLLIFWWKRGRLSWQRDVAPLLPWFVAGVAGGLLTAWVERRLIGAEGAPFELTLLQRCLLAGRVMWFYLCKLFWPVDLLFIYPRWTVNPAVWWQYLFSVGAIALVSAAWLMRRQSRGPLAALLFFIGSLFPALGFFNVFPFIFSFVADHFQYLSSLGIIVVVSAVISRSLARMPRRPRQAGQALCIMLLAVLGLSTWLRSQTYSDPQTLYQTTLDKNPDCWMCSNNLGILLSDAGQPSKAIEQFEATLRLKPDDAFAHNNLGKMLFEAGQLSAAMDHFEQAVRHNPKSVLLRMNLGSVLLTAGRLSEAVDQYQQAVRLRPTLVEARYRLGNALLRMEKLPEAKEQYESVLSINPDNVQARSKLYELRAREQATESKH